MEQRTLGEQGLEVSAMGLGCMGMSEFYGSADEKESIATIQHALDLGITLIDTADVYGPYTNEELVGRAIKGRRNQVVLATKFGIVRTSDPRARAVNGRPEYVVKCCDASLRRLQVDTIDLYYQHRIDPKVPIEDTVGAISNLVQAGKVRFIGLSEAGPHTIERAHATHPISVVQTEYSLWSRDVEDEVMPLLEKLGIGFVAYSPLGRGFLTGRFKRYEDLPPDDFRRYQPRFQAENFYKNLHLLDTVKKIAQDKRVSPGQLALSWVLSRGPHVVPIPGTTQRSHLEENLGALQIRLSSEDLESIDQAMPPEAVAGMRYAEAMMGLIGQ